MKLLFCNWIYEGVIFYRYDCIFRKIDMEIDFEKINIFFYFMLIQINIQLSQKKKNLILFFQNAFWGKYIYKMISDSKFLDKNRQCF